MARLPNYEHPCTNCDGWTEVWNDGDAGVWWVACECDAGYLSIKTVRRLRAEWESDLDAAKAEYEKERL